jgi:glutamyl-tRNA synthetase
VLDDLIKGRVEFATDEIGDFVIVRPDGTPLYNFASVVDDVDMEITHVVRAEEHLSNTFPQLLLFEALGATPPAFAHVPYVAEPGSKAKMSKRKLKEYEEQGVLVYLHQYIERGYLPQALMNYLARLGWSYDGTQEIFTREELIEKFTLERVNSSPASHDQDKLFWIEGEWMKSLSLAEKVRGVIPFLVGEGLIEEPVSEPVRARIEAVLQALGDRLKVFSDIVKLGRFFFEKDVRHDPAAVKKRLMKSGAQALLDDLKRLLAEVEPFELDALEHAVHDYAERSGRKLGDVVNALRVATTGQAIGPGLYDCLVILGRDACLRNLEKARSLLQPTTT